MRNPSRPEANGGARGLGGCRSGFDMARIELNPENATGISGASAPPATARSARPSRMAKKASPMALLAVAHAETGAKQGPWAPSFIETKPAAMFEIIMGMV